MVTTGAVFAALTVTVIEAEPVRPPLSVTEAVTVCTPTVSALVENEPPVPIWPWRSEVQVIDPVTAAASSSASVAPPAKAMLSPSVASGSLAGAVMVTTGSESSVYSTCNNGAPAWSPLKDSAVLSPVPVIMITSELRLDHPSRSTIS